MKFKIVFSLLLISIKAYCQLDNLGKFYSEKLNNKNEDNSFSIYKIKGNIYTSDRIKYFALGKKNLYVNKTNDYIIFKIYKKKYLFIGYYPKNETKDTLPSSLPPLLTRLEVIDLEDVSKKWDYNLSRKIVMENIHSFDPENGVIIYNHYLRPTIKD